MESYKFAVSARRFSVLGCALGLALFGTACSNSSGPGASSTTGGTPIIGGVTATGGVSTTGGVSGTGGTTATGGMPTAGGVTATGGVTTMGGVTTAGGATATGGVSTAGGVTAMAGTTARTGGTTVTGGATTTGGTTTGIVDAGSDGRDATVGDRAADARPAMEVAPGADVNTTTGLTVYVAGDSTVSTYTNSAIHQGGWGQFLQDNLLATAKVVNKAVGGMTARHFIEAGYLDQIVAVLKAGDYLLVQFGTNDSNTTATYTLPGSTTEIPYYLAAATDFKTYLTKYVDATKSKGAKTIFVTPPPRHSCNAGEKGVRNGLAAYATAMQELGPTVGAPVVELNAMVIAYLSTVTCETSGSTFYLVKADGTIDSTHFQENGASVMAGLVAKGTTGIASLNLSLSAYVR